MKEEKMEKKEKAGMIPPLHFEDGILGLHVATLADGRRPETMQK